jgi:hypothetical protein
MRKVLSFLVTLALVSGWVSARAEIPHLINYQGMLTDDSGSPLTDTVDITFVIYDDPGPTGGNIKWDEIQYGVPVINGLFNVILGSESPINLDFSQDYWLDITVEGEHMPERLRFTSVGYAYRAARSDTAYYAMMSSVPCTLDAEVFHPGAVLYVNNTGDGDGIEVSRAGNDGIKIGYVAGDYGTGIRIDSAKWEGIYIDKTQFGMGIGKSSQDGIAVNETGGIALLVGYAGTDGLHIHDAGDDGVYVRTAASDGIQIDTAAATGVYIKHVRAWHGVHVEKANVDGFIVNKAGNYGLYVDSAGWDGVKASGDVVGGRFIARTASAVGVYAHAYNNVATDTAIYAYGKVIATGGVSAILKGNAEASCLFGSEPAVVASGTGKLVHGKAEISFDPVFSKNVRNEVPIKITVTPRGKPAGFLYVAESKATGFKVELEPVPGLEKNLEDLSFDWIAFAALKEYETSPEATAQWDKMIEEREQAGSADDERLREKKERIETQEMMRENNVQRIKD